MRASSREECTADPVADREPAVFDLARYGQRQSRMSVPKLRFDDAWKRPVPRFIQLGAAFDLKRRCHHAAFTSHGISSAARRARANPEPVAAAPAAAMADLLPAADNPHICSGKSLVSELRAVPLPSSERTHLAVRLTVGAQPPHPFLA